MYTNITSAVILCFIPLPQQHSLLLHSSSEAATWPTHVSDTWESDSDVRLTSRPQGLDLQASLHLKRFKNQKHRSTPISGPFWTILGSSPGYFRRLFRLVQTAERTDRSFPSYGHLGLLVPMDIGTKSCYEGIGLRCVHNPLLNVLLLIAKFHGHSISGLFSSSCSSPAHPPTHPTTNF